MIKFTAGRYLPRRAHPDDAGTDLPLATDIVVPAGEHRQVGTGIHVAIPTGHVGLVHVRSSTGIKRHLVLSNGTGVIDSGYTGEILLSLHNTGRRVQRLHAGDYIAQLVIVPCHTTPWTQVDHLDTTQRGTNGIGSSGK